MRPFPIFLVVAAMVWIFISPSDAEDDVNVIQLARSHTSNLHLIAADVDHSRGDRWIVWDEGSGDGQTVHIELCNPGGACSWDHVWSDANEPTIRYMGRWSDEKASLFLVTYQQGAEAEKAIVIGYVRNEPPVIYDQRDGSWVTVAPDNNTLEINTSSGTELSLSCLGWNAASMRFSTVRCSWKPVGPR